jgi:hypothetical protein
MEPNNRLENEFRRKLEQRTIQPSQMAWDRLDAMLSVTEEKRKPKRTWMYVAASFLGFLLVGTLFLKQGSDNSNNVIKDNTNTVANSPAPAATQEKPQGGNPSTETIAVQPEAAYKEEVQVAAQTKATNKKAVTVKGAAVNTKTFDVPVTSNEAVAAVEQQQVQEKIIKSNDTEKLLNESLAQNESTAKKKSSLKVDPNSLLSSVEGELDQSFKEKALQGAVKNFNAIKTSVANRNHK